MDKYRTFGARVIALMIDGLICLPLLFFVIIVEKTALSARLWYLCFLAITLTPTVYRITMHALCGQTLGKMAAGIKVVTDSEQSITLNRAVLRSLPQMFFTISYLLLSGKADDFKNSREALLGMLIIFHFLWFFLDNFVALSSNKRKSLHDWLAGTVVVKI